MINAYIGTIVPWPVLYAPYGWLMCKGQSLSTQQYPALHALIGYTYGGSGTSFNLPNLTSRITLGVGQNALSTIPAVALAEAAGANTATIALPSHTHAAGGTITATLSANNTSATLAAPGATAAIAGPLKGATQVSAYVVPPATPNQTDIGLLSLTAPTFPAATGTSCGNAQGSAATFSTQPPVMTLNYMICWDGIFPPFS